MLANQPLSVAAPTPLQILALRVPQQLPSKQLVVDIEPYCIKGRQRHLNSIGRFSMAARTQ